MSKVVRVERKATDNLPVLVQKLFTHSSEEDALLYQ